MRLADPGIPAALHAPSFPAAPVVGVDMNAPAVNHCMNHWEPVQMVWVGYEPVGYEVYRCSSCGSELRYRWEYASE